MTPTTEAPQARRARTWRNLALTALVAFLAGAIGAGVGASLVRHRTPPGAESLHAMVHRMLDLSSDQDRALHEIEARFADRRRALEAQLAEANRALAAAIEAHPTYAPEVGAAVERVHAVMGELQTTTIQHIYDMRSILTPEQARVFDAQIARALASQN
jgi:Spy/CpxP family protein refolding chaperone